MITFTNLESPVSISFEPLAGADKQLELMGESVKYLVAEVVIKVLTMAKVHTNDRLITVIAHKQRLWINCINLTCVFNVLLRNESEQADDQER